MPYKVAIRKNETGEVRIRTLAELEWGEGSRYWWTLGNFGCDCNRDMEFKRAGGEAPDLDEIDCSEGKYSVLYAELETGERIVVDE